MTLSERQQTLVQRLTEARRLGTLVDPALWGDLTQADAYAIQAGVAQALGWFPQGPRAWKVGGSNPTTAAPLPEVRPSPATWPATGTEGVLVEAELAFRLARTPTCAEDVLACLGSVGVSLEVIGTRLAHGLAASPTWKLADQGVHAGLVLGPEVPYSVCAHFALSDWRQQPCQIRVNGQVAQAALGSHPGVNPLHTLPWLVAHAAAHTGGLRAGDLITTGAWLVVTAYPGDHVVADFAGIGCAELTLTA